MENEERKAWIGGRAQTPIHRNIGTLMEWQRVGEEDGGDLSFWGLDTREVYLMSTWVIVSGPDNLHGLVMHFRSDQSRFDCATCCSIVNVERYSY